MDRRNFLLGLTATGIQTTSEHAQAAGATLGTSRVLSVGTEGGALIGFKSYPRSLQLEDKELVLTFDDGPIAGPTNAVLDALAEEQVGATFFLIGRNAAAHPALVKRMAQDGHTIAYHSQTHPMTLRSLPEAAARANIEAGFASVDHAWGVSRAAPNTPFFRYPGFGDSVALNHWLAARNIAIFGTDIWASDWVDMTPHTQLELLMSRIRRAGRGIVLLHDPRSQTAKMLPAFLRALKKENYRIVHMVPGTGTVATYAAGAGWHSETERFLGNQKPRGEWPKAHSDAGRLP